MYTIYISPAATSDLVAAVSYYNEKLDGLGDRLFEETDKLLVKIASTPKAYSIRYRDIRAAKVKFFPYLLYYSISDELKIIDILRIFNTHQEPFWIP